MAGSTLTAPRGVDRFGWSERCTVAADHKPRGQFFQSPSDERSEANTAQAGRRFPSYDAGYRRVELAKL